MKKVWTIALNTFNESLRKKTLYILLVVALIAIGSSRLFGFLAAEDELKMLQDVSFATVEFFGALIAIFTAITAVSGEIDKRTIYTLLSKPVTRKSFILGKFVGQSMIVLLNAVLMSLLFIGLLFYKGSPPSVEVLKALILIYAQLLVVGAIALMIATFATDAFNVIFSLFLFVVGHLTGYLSQVLDRIENVVILSLGRVFYSIIPNYENFNVKDNVVLGLTISWRYVSMNLLYALVYIVIAILLAIYFFQKREV